MMGRTHLVGGLIAGALIGPNPIGLAISATASLLPDIDLPQSKIGQTTRPLSDLINKIFGHRGFTHSILALILLTIPIYYYSPQYSYYFLAGYLSHLILDALNPKGVSFFYPYKRKFKIPLLVTGSAAEKFITAPLVIFLAFLLIKATDFF